MTKAIAVVVFSLLFLSVLPTEASELKVLGSKYHCFSCHQIDKKVLGPAWTTVASRKQETSVLVNSILKGSKGKYSKSIPMPPMNIPLEDAQKLAEEINKL